MSTYLWSSEVSRLGYAGDGVGGGISVGVGERRPLGIPDIGEVDGGPGVGGEVGVGAPERLWKTRPQAAVRSGVGVTPGGNGGRLNCDMRGLVASGDDLEEVP